MFYISPFLSSNYIISDNVPLYKWGSIVSGVTADLPKTLAVADRIKFVTIMKGYAKDFMFKMTGSGYEASFGYKQSQDSGGAKNKFYIVETNVAAAYVDFTWPAVDGELSCNIKFTATNYKVSCNGVTLPVYAYKAGGGAFKAEKWTVDLADGQTIDVELVPSVVGTSTVILASSQA